MQVIVTRRDQQLCASITCISTILCGITGDQRDASFSEQNGGYSRTGRGPVPVAERDPITGALTRALWSPDLVVI